MRLDEPRFISGIALQPFLLIASGQERAANRPILLATAVYVTTFPSGVPCNRMFSRKQ